MDGKEKVNRFGAHVVPINGHSPCRMNKKLRRDDVFLLKRGGNTELFIEDVLELDV